MPPLFLYLFAYCFNCIHKRMSNYDSDCVCVIPTYIYEIFIHSFINKGEKSEDCPSTLRTHSTKRVGVVADNKFSQQLLLSDPVTVHRLSEVLLSMMCRCATTRQT